MRYGQLELLVRKAARADAGFEIRHRTADRAALHYRPHRAPDDQWETRPLEAPGTGTYGYLVKSRITGQIVQLSLRGWRLWQLMDGRHSVQELAATYFFEFNSLNLGEIRRTINHLRDAGLIDADARVPWFVGRMFASPRRSLAALARPAPQFRWSLRYANADALAERLHQAFGRFLFSPLALGLWLVVVELGLYYFASEDLLRGMALWAWAPAWQVLLFGYILPLLVLITPIHELAHAVVCRRHGRRVASMGVCLYYDVLPLPYADVTDVWMAPGLARVETYLAGPLSTLILGSAALLLHRVLPPHTWLAGWTLAVSLTCYAVTVITLYPFSPFDSDGYYVLSDLARCFSLRNESAAFVRSGLCRALGERRLLTRREWVYVGFWTLTTVSTWAIMLAAGYGLSRLAIYALWG